MNGSRKILQLAHEAYRRGHCGEARRLLSALQPSLGENSDALHLQGLLSAKDGDVAKARVCLSRAAQLAPEKTKIIADYARVLREAGVFGEAEAVLRRALQSRPDDPVLLAALGLLKREQDDRNAAATIFERLIAAHPTNVHGLNARARIELEQGGDARFSYAKALAISPGDRQLLLGAAASFYQQGERQKAVGILSRFLRSHPDWLEGLKTVARMRWQAGEEDFTADYESALKHRRGDPCLWLSFLRILGSSRGYELALARLEEARAAAGNNVLFDMFEAEALAEGGAIGAARAKFDALGCVPDPCFAPVYMRFLLRAGAVEEAAACGERFAAAPGAAFIWPYLGTAWRLLDNPRWAWLERYDETVAVIDVEPLQAILPELGEFLRKLHRDSRHPFDQSPRGGTQTDGALLQRSEPLITTLRSILTATIEHYVASLPPPDLAHPFLGAPRDALRFAGSWSIRLGGKGYHINHVHPQGWLSSALYIELPDGCYGSNDHSGWLALGAPPTELGLTLPPARLVEPKEGRLALFPSIMWHGTVPFDTGERLTVAFDVVGRGS